MTNCVYCGKPKDSHLKEELYCPGQMMVDFILKFPLSLSLNLKQKNLDRATQYRKPVGGFERYFASKQFDRNLKFIGISREDFNLLVFELNKQ